MRSIQAVRALCMMAVVGTLLAWAHIPASAAQDDLVTVKTGTLRGKVSGEGRQFLNVPFAAPPTGERRLQPPQPALAWSGVRDARQAGNICPQAVVLGNEDCLVLNVYTPPAASSRNLPVMVFVPGGAYNLGWGSMYDPAPLVAKGDVIAVTVNYRVGPLGFLALPGLADESGTTGNYGTLDQQAALRWVRDNIGAFGGSPGRVTLFGESAGGHSVCMQLISPTAAGLFHRAISESGGCVGTDLGPVPAKTAYARGETFAKAVGCTDPGTMVSCLRRKPASELQAAAGNPFPSDGLTWVPAIDGTVVKEPTRTALEAGRYNKVPLVTGTNKDEGRLFVALQTHLLQLRRANAADLEAAIRLRAGQVTDELRKAYPPQAADNADLALSAVLTDGVFSCPGLSTARAAASNTGQPVYAYEFADPEPPLSGIDLFMPLGAYHASELLYLFELFDLNAAQKRLSDQMVTYWTTFARTGNPNAPGLPRWPAFTSGSAQMQRLAPQGITPFTTFAADHKCALWD
ncbi:carboxylesterase/lipase family protein [Spirillospora sp. NPDC048911]|uniref:carboxylesterase/lipase family protein n=1 Tax=Spirillospora sp. NPDC048911 TaxID=3364527 RepID=UPI003722C0FA